VFASRVGTALWARNVRRSFRAVLAAAGLDPAEWTPPELRHSFVSLMSGRGVPIEKITRRVGYPETTTTKTVRAAGGFRLVVTEGNQRGVASTASRVILPLPPAARPPSARAVGLVMTRAPSPPGERPQATTIR
jgi:Phage integrase family